MHNSGQVISGNEIGLAEADMDIAEVWNITKGDSNLIIAVFNDGVDDNDPHLPNSLQVSLLGAMYRQLHLTTTLTLIF
ncbi:MAG: hypothetical protein ACI9DK_000805 [Vicingaceae bacterium]